MDQRSYLFMFLDLEASFAEGREGAKTRRLQGSLASRLGPEAWDLGHRAYRRLQTDAGKALSAHDLLEFMAREQPMIDGFFEVLNERVQAGQIKLLGPHGEEQEGPLKWREADWTWQVVTMVKFLKSRPGGFEAIVPELLTRHMLVAALLALDLAAIASFDGDIGGPSECLLDAAWLVDQVEALERADDEAQARLQVIESARASARAQLRHAKDPKRQAKDFVRECWIAWQAAPQTYASASAFARAMLDKFPELLTSEVVVTRWVRQWDREAEDEDPPR